MDIEKPKRGMKEHIDYITINKRFKNVVLHCKTYLSTDYGSDCIPVICNLSETMEVEQGQGSTQIAMEQTPE